MFSKVTSEYYIHWHKIYFLWCTKVPRHFPIFTEVDFTARGETGKTFFLAALIEVAEKSKNIFLAVLDV